MNLRLLLQDTPFYDLVKESDYYEINMVVSSSKEAGADTVFACLCGHHTDGHLYMKDAYLRGCRVFICEKNYDDVSEGVFIKTSNVKGVAWKLLSKLYNYPERAMIFIGITGTKGKTTTACFIETLLTKSGIKNATVGTLGAVCGMEVIKTKNTTPDFFFLMPILAKWRDENVKVVTIEMSSQSLADERLCYLPIQAGIFTCIGMDHIGSFEHPDFRSYYLSKRKLFSDYPLKFAVVNDDDIYADTVTNTGISRYTVSQIHPADYYGFIKRLDAEKMLISYEGKDYCVPFPGTHQLYNTLLACACVSRLFDIPMAQLLPLLSDVKIDGRFERYQVNGKNVIIDYAHNATSLYAITSLCRKIYRGQVFAVFGSVGGRGRERRFDLAKMGERMCDYCILTSDNPGYENPYRILSDMYDAFFDKTKAKTIKDRKEAIRYAMAFAKENDVILLLGKGREPFQEENGKEIPYSEKEALFSAVSP